MTIDEAAFAGAQQILLHCLGLTSKQQLLVFADETTIHVATIIAEAAYQLGVSQTIIMVPVSLQRRIPAETDLSVLALGAAGEARAILTCVNGSPDCLKFRDRLLETNWGARTKVGHMPGASIEVLKLANVDIEQLANDCHKLELAMARGRKLEFISYTTDGTPHTLTADIGGWERLPVASDGIIKDGIWGNVPSGETYIAPVEDTASGSVVINGSLPGHVIAKDESIILRFEAGRLVAIEPETNPAARWLKETHIGYAQNEGDQNWSNLAEIGIGVNPAVDHLTGTMLFDEKSAGTAHVALGSNTFMGGTIESVIHCDMVVRAPSILIDGKSILDHGSLSINEDEWRENYQQISMENSPVIQSQKFVRSGIEALSTPDGRLYRLLRSEPGRLTKYLVGDDETARLANKVYLQFSNHGEALAQDAMHANSGLDALTVQRIIHVLWDYGLLELTSYR